MTPVRQLVCTRYITPLREGGSLPAIVEAQDDGLYVMKFLGAGQGPKALIAELVAGLLGQALGLPIPELVLLHLEADLPRLEGDDEVQHLLKQSCGINLGVDYLPGSISHDAGMFDRVDPGLASSVLWFDGVIANVDRTARNTNMLWWHDKLWLIDHGASLIFHHQWENVATSPVGFSAVASHVLKPRANALPQAHARMAPLVTRALLADITAQVPDAWLTGDHPFADHASHRAAYVDMLLKRVAAADAWVHGGTP
jgi:hypothetical protein